MRGKKLSSYAYGLPLHLGVQKKGNKILFEYITE